MANTPQAKKRIRRNDKRAAVNGARVSRIRTFIKAVESALDAGDKKTASDALKQAQPELARGVARGVVHKNTASRKFSRLTKRVAALGYRDSRATGLTGPALKRASRHIAGPVRFVLVKKSEHFPRFAAPVVSACCKKPRITAKLTLSPVFLVSSRNISFF